ncbi:MAG: reverse transcriptase family protein [Myxococcales bacterium]|nr:reverse transcriptase family protein [Polyangiaceae bacterium]MDW8249075.1 reverse transcriptase family protein [Myxococcales bacterium]
MTDSYRPKTRQEIYDRIRATSKDEYILEEMVRLGFWPAQGVLPSDPADEVRRMGEIQQELRKLREQLDRSADLDALRRELREQRLRESKDKQHKTKEQREIDRKARAEAWARRKHRELLYLGEGVSSGLSRTKGDPERLRQHGLPVFSDPADLAQQMGLSLEELRFLAFHRKVSKIHHYARFILPKKTGGERIISAPMPRLKKVQRWILDNLLKKIPVHDAAHGFRDGRSIVTNATPHLRAAVVVNLDLQDFFPSVNYQRVRGIFRSLGYSDAIATPLALLCTEAEVDVFDLDGEHYFVASGPRKLPQGAPTSPALTNLICSRLDRRLCCIANRMGFVYTRYADDLTFSAQGFSPSDGAPRLAPNVGPLLRRVRWVIQAEGFRVHPNKTRILHRSRRQEVTGIVVNQRLSVDRETLRKFRALLFQIEKDGPEGKHWGAGGDVLAAAVGYANFVAMVTPDKGRPLRARALALQARWGKGKLTTSPTHKITSPEPPPETPLPEPTPKKK